MLTDVVAVPDPTDVSLASNLCRSSGSILVEVSSSAEDKEVSDCELSAGVDSGEADEEDALEANT